MTQGPTVLPDDVVCSDGEKFDIYTSCLSGETACTSAVRLYCTAQPPHYCTVAKYHRDPSVSLAGSDCTHHDHDASVQYSHGLTARRVARGTAQRVAQGTVQRVALVTTSHPDPCMPLGPRHALHRAAASTPASAETKPVLARRALAGQHHLRRPPRHPVAAQGRAMGVKGQVPSCGDHPERGLGGGG